MYTVRIDCTTTLERLEAGFESYKEAHLAAVVAFFAASDDMDISIISPDGKVEEF